MFLHLLIPVVFYLNPAVPVSGNITVEIDGLTKAGGTMVIGLFDNKKDFNVTPVKFFRVTVKDLQAIKVVFMDIPYNSYAISVYQDVNDNGKLDKNYLGIPTEPYGFSNDPVIITGPSYEKSMFVLRENDISMKINLH